MTLSFKNIINKLLITFVRDSLFLNSTIADNVGVVVSSVTMIGPRLKRKKCLSLISSFVLRFCLRI